MAGNLHVRNVDDDLIARLKRRAAQHGRSAEAEHREILRQALASEIEPSFEELAARFAGDDPVAHAYACRAAQARRPG